MSMLLEGDCGGLLKTYRALGGLSIYLHLAQGKLTEELEALQVESQEGINKEGKENGGKRINNK